MKEQRLNMLQNDQINISLIGLDALIHIQMKGMINTGYSFLRDHQMLGYSFVTMSTNSWQFILPSPSLSAYWIICSISAGENLSPTSSQTRVNYSTPKTPSPFLSKIQNSCCSDFSLLVSLENPNIDRNVGKSISQASLWVCTICRILPASFSNPSARIAVTSSSADTLPLLSQSKISKHSFSLETSSAEIFLVAQRLGSKTGGPSSFFLALSWVLGTETDDLDIV